MTYTVPVICAWCQADLGTSEGHTTPLATHGICPECLAEMAEEISLSEINKQK